MISNSICEMKLYLVISSQNCTFIKSKRTPWVHLLQHIMEITCILLKKNIDQLIFFFACRLHFSAELRGCATLDFPKKLQSQRQGEVGWVLAQSQIASANIFSSCWHLRTHVWSDICLRLTELICNSIIFDCVVDDLSQCSLHSATAERRQCGICRADPAPFSAPLPSQHPRWLPPPPHQIDWQNSSAYFIVGGFLNISLFAWGG